MIIHQYNVHSHNKIVLIFDEEMKRRREENIPFLILNADGGANTFQKHINCKIHFYNRENREECIKCDKRFEQLVKYRN